MLQTHFLQEVFLTLMHDHDISVLLPQTGLSQRVEWLLMSNPSHHWTQGVVAEMLHMSSPTLRRQLAAEENNFRTILENTRMAYAWDLLHKTQQSVLEIAQACGYVSASRFTARFREHFGMTPSAARKPRNSGELVGIRHGDKCLYNPVS
jgi:AraC-like DNA-binding protein